ncbi:MAG TPA: HlyD family efflux transporter periplasmic adaptor subunit [Candidatus Hydrogenedentes bacterium]|nr:HlyD family efflux transporter periplasmic adaptor subunit [Candidatus Hydrogenedentota bacterium]
MKDKRKLLVAPLLAAAVVAGAIAFGRAGSDDAGHAIRISGNIEATSVESSFRIAGWVAARLVSEGESVQAGQPLACLDREELAQEAAMRRAEVVAAAARLAELEAGSRAEEIARAKAAVSQAQARLDELEAGSRPQEIEAARAAMRRAEAEKVRAETDYARAQHLYEQGVVSAQERDSALAAHGSTRAILTEVEERYRLVAEGPRQEQIAQARAALAEAQAWYEQALEGPRVETIEQVRAEKQRAEEALRLAEIRLSYASIAAPMAGIVLSDHVEPGEYVTPGAPVLSIGDLENVWLRGYINETDLGRVKWGQRVTVATDTYPDKTYSGVLSFIASEAEFTPKHVQTDKERVKLVYRVKIDIPNPDLELKPGMPADAVIWLDEGEQ